MLEKIKAYHKSYIGQQIFIIYIDGKKEMFYIPFDAEKPDEFFPNEEKFSAALNELFKK